MTYKILAVDDEPSIVKLIDATLSSRGHQVFQAFNGAQALEKAAEVLPDLVLLDIRMPGMGGREVRKRLKDDARTAHIPVVYLSAVGDFQSQLDGMEQDDLSGYITKPFVPAELARDVESYLDPRTRDAMARERRSRAGSLRAIVEIMHKDRDPA